MVQYVTAVNNSIHPLRMKPLMALSPMLHKHCTKLQSDIQVLLLFTKVGRIQWQENNLKQSQGLHKTVSLGFSKAGTHKAQSKTPLNHYARIHEMLMDHQNWIWKRSYFKCGGVQCSPISWGWSKVYRSNELWVINPSVANQWSSSYISDCFEQFHVVRKVPRLDTGCIAKISLLIYSAINRI